jgi:hypothetical protein
VGVAEAAGGRADGFTERGRVSRRSFVTNTVRASTVGGAALWVAPKLSSVPVAQGAIGTKPPEEPNPTDQVGPPAVTVVAERPSGVLPMTGADSLFLAALGGTSVLAGRALLELRRHLEARDARPPADPDTSAD